MSTMKSSKETDALKCLISANTSQMLTTATKSPLLASSEAIEVDDIRVGYRHSLKDVLMLRNITFRNEFNSERFAMTTAVSLKEGNAFKEYPCMKLENSAITVLKMKKDINEFDTDNPVLYINFNQCTAAFKIDKKNKIVVLSVLSYKPTFFTFKFNTSDEVYKTFVTLLHTVIFTSKGRRTNLLGVSLRPSFHQNYFLTHLEFEKKAKTGDILIFRGFECPAKLQRCYTHSEYDHVALLIRRNGVLNVYEATSKEGCKVRPWRDFILYLWNLLYDKIVYRELVINSEDKIRIELDIQRNVENFLTKTEKKKYHISICDIVCGKKEKEYEKKNLWEKAEGYTCSALVCGAMINMGVMNYSQNVEAILPGYFSKENKNIRLNPPFALGPETIIDFSN